MRYILTALVVLMFATAVASANGIGFYGSFWKPEDLDNAFGGGAKLQVEVVPGILLEARGGYFPKAKEEDVDEIEIDIIPVEAGGILKLPIDVVTPYVGGGIGYYMFNTAKEPSGVTVEVENKFGLYGVAGLEIALGEVASLFGEAKYTYLDKVEVTAKSGGASVSHDDGKLSGFGANAGILLKW